MDDTLLDMNRRSWNAAVLAHQSHRGDLAAFLRAGGSTLFPEELALLGDVRGKRLAHLLCNNGQDTLSLAACGAQCVGVDISDEAIALARQLSAQSGISATFARAEIYAWLAEHHDAQFDLAYASYGVICWLPDIDGWAQALAQILAPGGRFVLIEFHPLSNMLDTQWQLKHDYPQQGKLLELPGVGDYVGAAQGGLSPAGFERGVEAFVNPHPCYLYRWGVGEVVSALIRAGLQLELLREYTYMNGEQPFETMCALSERRFTAPEGVPAVPLMYGLRARRG
jgi:SAM-dependent methyltransferase